MNLFLVTGAQTIALSLAGLALWYGWRRFRFAPRPLFLIVTAGFLLRLVAGEILFWISFLELPIGRSLQLGNGLWFFGLDGVWYVHFASTTAAQGMSAILHVDNGLPAPVYLQALSSFMYLFGDAPSVAVLLNACCYLLACAILVSLIRRDDRLRTPGLVVMAAVSFAPGSFLWYLQPMKDVFMTLLLIAFIGCLVAWQELWSRGADNRQIAWRAPLAGAVMFAILYSIAGVRWYVAMTLWVTFPIFLIALFIAGKRHRFVALGAGLLLAAILGESVLLGGAAYLVGFRPFVAQGKLMSGLITWLERSRSGFERTGGATAIAAGPALLERTTPPPAQAQPATPAPPAVAEIVRRAPARPPSTAPLTAAASQPDDANSDRAGQETTTVAALDPPSKATPADTQPPPRPAPEIAQPRIAVAAAKPAPQPATAATPPLAMASHSEALAAKPPVIPAKPPVVAATVAPPKSEAVTSGGEAPVVTRRPEARRPQKKVQTKPEPVAPASAVRTVMPTSAAVVARSQPPRPAPATAVPQPPSRLPTSNGQRFLAGLAATLLPRTVAQSFGIISVGGGKGLWLVVEADTIVFDAMLLFAAITSIRLFMRVRSLSPSLLALAVSCVILGAGVVYTVSNFGTLFRLRDMLFTELCMLPLLTIAMRDRAAAGSPGSESLEGNAGSSRVHGVEPSL